METFYTYTPKDNIRYFYPGAIFRFSNKLLVVSIGDLFEQMMNVKLDV